MKNYGIILASGTGNRYSNEIPKQFVKIAGKTILEHTIEIFEKSEYIDETIIVITPEYHDFATDILRKNKYKKISKLLDGGNTRKDSSSIGVSSIEENEANVIIHDCARPFLSQKIIFDCINALNKYDAVDVAIPTADTIIQVKNNIIENIPDRTYLKRGQTPQCFKLSLIKKAHEISKNDSKFTDDCGIILKYRLAPVYVVEGDIENIKVTYPSDIFLADKLFQVRNTSTPEKFDLKLLKDKVIVIFGGTSGIGKCISEIAKSHGAKVFTASKRTGCNITNYNDIEDFLKSVHNKTRKIDYIVNTAGVLKIGEFETRSINEIQEDVNINLVGTLNISKASIPYLKETQGQLELFASSSYTRGRAKYSTYSSSKAGIVNFAQALAEELYDAKVRVNVINPERTATSMRFDAFGEEPKESLLLPQTVAESALKTLLSDLTGQIIDIKN